MNALRFVSAVTLGLLAGSLALEGLVLVPFWRALHSDAFTKLHAGFGPRLYRYFAPLTVAATLLALGAGIDVAWRGEPRLTDWWTVAAAAMAGSLLGIYQLYFHAANERLPVLAAAGDDGALAAELRRWHRIHVARTVVCVAAFILALLGTTS